MEAYVKSDIINGVGEVEFFHPKSNSLPSNLLNELAKTIKSLGENDQVKCILLKSGGEKAFCAGASFDELLSIKNKEEGKAFFSGFANVIAAIKNAPKFVVTLLQGKVVGGGVGVVCASDYVIANENASCKLSELSIGIGPFVIGPAVERKIGLAHFNNMSLNPTSWKSASWALDKGMYAEVVNDVKARGAEIVDQYVKYSPEAMSEMKSMFWKGADGIEADMIKRAEQSGTLVLSDFTRETLKAFKSK